MSDVFPSKSVMSIRQAVELDFAFERNGFKSADVKLLSEKDRLAQVLLVLRGQAKVVPYHLIDCDTSPAAISGFKVTEHIKGGQVDWDALKIRHYLSRYQKCGAILGHDLYKELNGQPVINACVLDYLLAHQEIIPEEWKDLKARYFWGTIYEYMDGLSIVRSLVWRGHRFGWQRHWLADVFDSDCLALLAA